MNLNREKGALSMLTIAIMALAMTALPLAVSLVGQSQENRSKAVTVEDSSVVQSKLGVGSTSVTKSQNIIPVCGSAHKTITSTKPTGAASLCEAGTVGQASTSKDSRFSFIWSCYGISNGTVTSVVCYTFPPDIPNIDPVCGTAHKTITSTKPTGAASLCETGTVGTYQPSVSDDPRYSFIWGCFGAFGTGKMVACYTFAPTSPSDTKVASISVSPNSKNVMVGGTFTITPAVLPSNATNKSISWLSNRPSVASVTASGVVTAKSVGSAIITLTALDGSNKKATVAVTVTGTKVNGVCGSKNGATMDHFPNGTEACKVGSINPVDKVASDGVYNWTCLGSNGGSNTTCSAKKTPAKVNGVCGSIRNTCKYGDAEDGLAKDTTTYYKWVCKGRNGGVNSPVCQLKKTVVTSCDLTVNPISLKLVSGKSGTVTLNSSLKGSTLMYDWTSSNEAVARVFIPACSGSYINRCEGSNYYLSNNVKRCTKCAGLKNGSIEAVGKGTAQITVTSEKCGKKIIPVTVN